MHSSPAFPARTSLPCCHCSTTSTRASAVICELLTADGRVCLVALQSTKELQNLVCETIEAHLHPITRRTPLNSELGSISNTRKRQVKATETSLCLNRRECRFESRELVKATGYWGCTWLNAGHPLTSFHRDTASCEEDKSSTNSSSAKQTFQI